VVGDLKARPLEFKADAQLQPLHCNLLFYRLELKIHNFLYICCKIPSRHVIEQKYEHVLVLGRKKLRERNWNIPRGTTVIYIIWTHEAESFLRTTKIHYHVY
jgi:hypothetical protein